LLAAGDLSQPLDEVSLRHLEGCGSCQNLQEMLSIGSLVGRMDHPIHREHQARISELELGEWAAGMLSEVRATEVATLVEGCPVCRHLAHQARQEMGLLEVALARESVAETSAQAVDMSAQSGVEAAADPPKCLEEPPEGVRTTTSAIGSAGPLIWLRAWFDRLWNQPLFSPGLALALAALLAVVILPRAPWWQTLSDDDGDSGNGIWRGIKGGGVPLSVRLQAEVYVRTKTKRWRKIDQLQPFSRSAQASGTGSPEIGQCPIGSRIKFTVRAHGPGYLSLWRTMGQKAQLKYASEKEPFLGTERLIPPLPDKDGRNEILPGPEAWLEVMPPVGDRTFRVILSAVGSQELPAEAGLGSSDEAPEDVLATQAVRCLATAP